MSSPHAADLMQDMQCSGGGRRPSPWDTLSDGYYPVAVILALMACHLDGAEEADESDTDPTVESAHVLADACGML